MENIFNYTKKDLEEYFESINEKKFHATQVTQWLYQKKEFNFDNFSNVNKSLIEKLKNKFKCDFIEIKKVEEDIDTSKFLFKLFDNQLIEAVLMRHDYGLSLCVSSQVGCNMACSFCESGRRKKVRNLETYEIVQQILLIESYIKERINSIVIMGIGEPFDNYDNILKFIKIINDDKGLAIGARKITVSTCGLIPKIKEFANENIQVNLAISLHASNNELRSKIMPVNKVYNLNELMTTIREYIEKTGRRVTIEYVMLDNVNDSKENAYELINLLKGLNVYVNLIPYNETSHIEYKKSNDKKIKDFADHLKKNNIDVTIRRKYGSKISAACGQLRSKEECLD